MALCSDPSITYLNKFGYNVVKLPRKGIEPMDIIGKDASTEWLGPLSAAWKSTIAVPPPGPAQPAVAVSGQKSDSLKLSVGLKVLANALAAFGATVPSLDVAYTRARNVQFTFTDVTSTSVSPMDAGNYLAGGDLNTASPIIQHYFLEGSAHAFLIFDVLKSDSISVTATDSNGVGVTVDVPQIQGLVGANVGVTTSASSQSTLTYKGQVPVTFGFKAFAISFANGKWSLAGAAASPDISFAAAAVVGGANSLANQPPVILTSSGLLNM